MLSSEKMQWFAMRATYRRGMQIKALLDKEGINNFIPMRYEVRIRNGRKRRELVPVIICSFRPVRTSEGEVQTSVFSIYD